MNKTTAFFTSVLIAIAASTFGQVHYAKVDLSAGTEPSPWADSVLKSMTIEERIGQLFMVAAYSNKDANHEASLLNLVSNHNIGGLIFFQGGPVRQARITNHLQTAAKVPLMIGIDGEWGLAMRLDSTVKYPYQMTLGAIQNDSLIYAMGAEIARQCRRLGIHVNFAPVADVNNNPRNPVINYRSFGEDRDNVARKSIAYMKGMQDFGVMANAKHFPGHGDTDTDSHLALPVIKHDRSRLERLELYPFRKMIDEGLASVMVAHLSIPALDSTPNLASTLSPKVVDGLLKTEMGFRGLVFTDALNMKGVANYYAPGEVDLKAFLAGNDILLFPENVPKAVAFMKKAMDEGRISETELNARVLKILRAKSALGLENGEQVNPVRLFEDLNTPAALHLKRKLSQAAVTVVQNKDNIVPLKKLGERNIAVLTVGGNGSVFRNRLSKYCNFDALEAGSTPTAAEVKKVRAALEGKNTVVIFVEGTNQSPGRNFGLSKEAIAMIESLASDFSVIMAHMGNPYALAKLTAPERLKAVVVGYQDDAYMSRAVAEVIGGAIPATGKLPVGVGNHYKAQTGYITASLGRLYQSSPLEYGLSPDAFAKVDSIAVEGLRKRAYPGCQILVAKDGKVIYDKNFGFHTYEEDTPVASSDVYDLASITKIAASTISLMKLQDEGRFNLENHLSDYFPELPAQSEYRTVNLRRMMAHQAGLVSWIPFYKNTVSKGGVPRPGVFSAYRDDYFSRQVARDMYINEDVSDSIMIRIVDTPLNKDKSYKYSDMGYYFVREIVKRQSGLRLDRYAADNFYTPLGLTTMGFLPLERMSPNRIVPTEYDSYFRQQLVHGYVHDPGAAMLGGVGGHAGVFSNAYDLAVLMQMLVNRGTYGGERFLSEEVVEEYIRCQFCKDERDENRRGAGFDKPVIPPGPGPTCKCVSFDTFGHSGFTGTIAWADPVENIVYIFLSNRVYPTAENNRLAKMDIRTRIQSEIYKVLNPTETAQSGAISAP